ncbi:MAG TPA: redoxin domain-containing protein [Anaerolineales bacterium]|nr:redoxin domain-containing protein [Anaerolineales bacterium]
MNSPADLLNKPAPDFSLPLAGGNGRLALSSWRGHVVIVHFWSAECPWSRRADLVLAYRQLVWEQAQVHILGVACNPTEPESEIRHEIELRRIRYPIVVDYAQDIANLYRVQTTPHLLVVDKHGVIRYIGALDDATASQPIPNTIYLDRAITAILKDQAPAPAFIAPYGSALPLREIGEIR